MSINLEVAQDLLNIKAVQINPNDYFTWASGIKSPIYCDNRLTMSYPEIRNKISDTFKSMVEELDEKPDVIAGCATAGIPHAAWLSEKLDLPMVYVRSSAKNHGKQNQIEGNIKAGQKVVLIEDLISTGGSVLEAAKALELAGAKVITILAIFTYGLNKATVNFNEKELSFQTITGFDQLVDLLVKEDSITNDEKTNLLNWRNTLG